MINADMYFKMINADECSYEDLIRERDKLCANIKELERLIFEDIDKTDPAWKAIPSPDASYPVSLIYLEELTKLMQKRYFESKYSA